MAEELGHSQDVVARNSKNETPEERLSCRNAAGLYGFDA